MSSKSVSIWLRYSNTKLNILTVTLRRKICSKAIQFLKLCLLFLSLNIFTHQRIYLVVQRFGRGFQVVWLSLWCPAHCGWWTPRCPCYCRVWLHGVHDLKNFHSFLKILMKSKPNINSFSVCLSGGPMSSIFILENLVTSVAEPVHFWPALAPSIFFHRLQLRLRLQLL